MFEGGSGSAHHVEDVGRILLQVQDNLRGLRESLKAQGALPVPGGGGGGGAGAGGRTLGRHDTRAAETVAQLDTVLQRAEHDLRMKAEVVLNSVIQNTVRTLPSIRKPSSAGSATATFSGSMRSTLEGVPGAPHAPSHRGGSGGLAASPAARRRALMTRTRPKSDPKPASRVRDRMLEAQAFSHFDIHNEDHRQFLRQRYGVPFKNAAERLETRVNQRSAGVRKTGRRGKAKLTQPAGLLPLKNRRDPLAPPPPVTDADVNKGIFSLINRGLLPSTIDVTAAFREGRSVVQNPVRMHDWAEQFVPTAVYTSPFGFSAANVKLDLAPKPLQRTMSEPRGPKVGPKPAPQRKPHTQTLQYSGPVAPDPIRKPRGQPTLPAPESPQRAAPHKKKDADTAAEQELREAVDKIRGYNELLDEFSLHQFIIRRGRVLDSTPEFRSFKRTHAGQWGPITIIISALERLLTTYSVPTAYVDGQAVAQLASDELASANPTTEALLQCIANIDQVAPLLKLPGQRFVGKHGRIAAAVAIQSIFRMYLCRLMYLGRKSLSAAAHTIQHAWRGYSDARQTRAKLRAAQLDAEDRWAKLMETFRRRWPQIQRRRRVVIHIPSISAEEHVRWGIPHFSTRQNLQMARLCAIADPLVDVIYVAPFALTDDLRSYYQKLLAVGGVEDVSHRFKVVVPENLSRFPDTISLTSAILYSPRCLRRIKHFARGKEAYIVPGVVGPEDKRLSMLLNIPLLAAEPSSATLYSTKSGSKRIFAMADVNTPPGAHDIYEEEEVYAALTKLIAANTHVKRWIFKVDDEFGGRGHAYLDVGGLKVVQSLRRQRESMTEAKWADPEVQAAAAHQVNEALRRNLARRVTIVVPTLYASWGAYLKAFTRLGGVIEAATADTLGNPSVNLFISPSGTVQVTSTHEQLFAQPYRQIGAAFPQRSVPYQALAGAATAIGQVLRQKGVMGYVGIDFVTFWDKAVGSQRLWAVDLNLRLTSTACSFALFNFLMGGELDTDTGLYIVDTKGRPSTTASGRDSVVSRRTAASYERVGALLGERPGSSASSAFGDGAGAGAGASAGLGSDSVMSSARSVRPPSAAMSSRKGSGGMSAGGAPPLMPGFAYRSYVSHDYVFHPNLSSLQYASFFNLCRLQGISFDLHERVGTAFVLVDSLAGGIIGMLSVGRNPIGASKAMQKSLEFIAAQVGARAPVSEFDDEASNFQDILTSTKKRTRALNNRA